MVGWAKEVTQNWYQRTCSKMQMKPLSPRGALICCPTFWGPCKAHWQQQVQEQLKLLFVLEKNSVIKVPPSYFISQVISQGQCCFLERGSTPGNCAGGKMSKVSLF